MVPHVLPKLEQKLGHTLPVSARVNLSGCAASHLPRFDRVCHATEPERAECPTHLARFLSFVVLASLERVSAKASHQRLDLLRGL